MQVKTPSILSIECLVCMSKRPIQYIDMFDTWYDAPSRDYPVYVQYGNRELQYKNHERVGDRRMTDVVPCTHLVRKCGDRYLLAVFVRKKKISETFDTITRCFFTRLTARSRCIYLNQTVHNLRQILTWRYAMDAVTRCGGGSVYYRFNRETMSYCKTMQSTPIPAGNMS